MLLLPAEPPCPYRFTLYCRLFVSAFAFWNQNCSFLKHICEFMPWHGRSTTAVDLGRCDLGRCELGVCELSRINQVSLTSILEIIDDLANLVENTDEKLRTEARRVTLVDRKSTSCGKRWQLPQPPGAGSSLRAPCCCCCCLP